ncbi:MAG: hypothetical protein AAF690_15100 [Acidobacteriota bacterium]
MRRGASFVLAGFLAASSALAEKAPSTQPKIDTERLFEAFDEEPSAKRKEPIVEGRFGGHAKLQSTVTHYPGDSLLRDLQGATWEDGGLDLRLTGSLDFGRIDLVAEGQLVGLFGDRIELTRSFGTAPGVALVRFQDDAIRGFDLTSVRRDRGRTALLTRFDRLSVGYTGPRNVLRVGRQAVTWGNGFVYTPMDVFNPFDPAAVDREFKPGDDMVYAQHLLPRGDDLQAVWVVRRDPRGDRTSDVSSLALKYHGLFGAGEIDALVARHYGDDLYGVGGSLSIGGAVLRGDVVVTESELGTTVSAVSGITRSWVLGGKNVSAFVELHRNGFGQPGRRYSGDELAANPELLERLARQEMFTLGRSYAAASVTVEVTPLFLLTPNLFVNVEDTSGLLQIVGQNDLSQDLVLQTAIGLPFGDAGTEFGGLPTPIPGRFVASGPSLFVQIARYF